MSKPENAKLSESVEKLLLHLLPHTPSPPTLQVLEVRPSPTDSIIIIPSS